MKKFSNSHSSSNPSHPEQSPPPSPSPAFNPEDLLLPCQYNEENISYQKKNGILTKLFIGGVPPNMQKNALAELFTLQRDLGNFPDCEIVDVSTHKGFGFILING